MPLLVGVSEKLLLIGASEIASIGALGRCLTALRNAALERYFGKAVLDRCLRNAALERCLRNAALGRYFGKSVLETY